MKQSLIDEWRRLMNKLPAKTYHIATPIYTKLHRIEYILWGRYQYDIALKYTM